MSRLEDMIDAVRGGEHPGTVAARFDVSESYVRGIARDAGVDVQPNKQGRPSRRMQFAVVRLLAEGEQPKDIAAGLELHYRTVLRIRADAITEGLIGYDDGEYE